MKSYRVAVSRLIAANPKSVYAILADYRAGYPRILPKPWFGPLHVERGGVGAGTVIRFEMFVLGRKQKLHATIEEPEPGRQLDEIYLEPAGLVTRFLVQPDQTADQSIVTIATEGPTRTGPLFAWLERSIAAACLRPIFEKELDLLATVAAGAHS